jgi:hypothetical protein
MIEWRLNEAVLTFPLLILFSLCRGKFDANCGKVT